MKATAEKNRRSNYHIFDLAYISIGAAMIAICSWISIPAAIPFTLQTFAVFLVLLTLGGRRGTIAVGVYILLGATGLPVFANFNAGLGYLLGATGGYILGFIFMGLIYWLVIRVFGDNTHVKMIAMLIGLMVLYMVGTIWFLAVYTKGSESVGFFTILTWCVIPFIVPDLIKMGIALQLSRRLAPILSRINSVPQR